MSRKKWRCSVCGKTANGLHGPEDWLTDTAHHLLLDGKVRHTVGPIPNDNRSRCGECGTEMESQVIGVHSALAHPGIGLRGIYEYRAGPQETRQNERK